MKNWAESQVDLKKASYSILANWPIWGVLLILIIVIYLFGAVDKKQVEQEKPAQEQTE